MAKKKTAPLQNDEPAPEVDAEVEVEEQKPTKKSEAEKKEKSFLMKLSEAQINNSRQIKRIQVPLTDVWLYGGTALGNRTAIIGPPAHGKSTLLYITMGALIRTCKRCNTMARMWYSSKGKDKSYTCSCGKNDFYNVMLLDLEGRSTFLYLRQLGCHVEVDDSKIEIDDTHKSYKLLYAKEDVPSAGKVYIMQAGSGEEMYELVAESLRSSVIQGVIIDSLNSIPPGESVEDFKQKLGSQARLHSYGLRILSTVMNEAAQTHGVRPTVLWSNHVSEVIGSMSYGTQYKESGGNAPKFYEDTCIEMKGIYDNDEKVTRKPWKDLDHTVVTEYRFKVIKNTVGMNRGYTGSYHIFSDHHKTPTFSYTPGMTWEHEKLAKLCNKYGFFSKISGGKYKYDFFGKKFSRQDEIVAHLSQESAQWEARYWLSQLLATDISRFYIKEKDYLYGPFLEEERERLEEVRERIVERLRLRGIERESSASGSQPEENTE